MLVAFSTATIAILAPWALMMPPGVAYGAGAALTALGLVRGRQAWRVMRYQRKMRRLPTYRLRSSQIPVSQRKLFLGKGFRWTQKHTQRLRDTIRPEVQHYVQPGGPPLSVGSPEGGGLGVGSLSGLAGPTVSNLGLVEPFGAAAIGRR